MIWYTTEFAVRSGNNEKKNVRSSWVVLLSCIIVSSDSVGRKVLCSVFWIFVSFHVSLLFIFASRPCYMACVYCTIFTYIRVLYKKYRNERGEGKVSILAIGRRYEKYTQHNSCKMCVRVLKEQGKTRKNL